MGFDGSMKHDTRLRCGAECSRQLPRQRLCKQVEVVKLDGLLTKNQAIELHFIIFSVKLYASTIHVHVNL